MPQPAWRDRGTPERDLHRRRRPCDPGRAPAREGALSMLIELQRVLQAALASDTPLDSLREAVRGLPAEARAILERVDPEGFVVGSLLVRKLRFERICRGDSAM